MAKYVVKILGTNGSLASVTGETGMRLVSGGGADVGRDGRVFVASDGGDLCCEEERVALFEDRELADEVGLACRWNNQRYAVVPARGRVREVGRVVTRGDLGAELTSCQ